MAFYTLPKLLMHFKHLHANQMKVIPVFLSRSWSSKEPELLAGAVAGAGILKFRLRVKLK
jgi:hypothetical protein